jgi:hypothetical protein
MVGIFCKLDGNGKIKHETDLVDNLGMLKQLGVLSEQTAAVEGGGMQERGRTMR